MLKTARWMLGLSFSLFALTSCGFLTDPKPLEEFEYVAVVNPDEVTDSFDAQPFFGEINMLGQFHTPSLCFTVVPTFVHDGSNLSLTVEARPTNSSNCGNAPGGFRYTGVLRHLDAGTTYTLHVMHVVPGLTTQEYTTTMTL